MLSIHTVATLCKKRAGEIPTKDEENLPSGVRWCGCGPYQPEKCPEHQPSETKIQMVRCRQKGTQKATRYDSLKRRVSKRIKNDQTINKAS